VTTEDDPKIGFVDVGTTGKREKRNRSVVVIVEGTNERMAEPAETNSWSAERDLKHAISLVNRRGIQPTLTMRS
jgi:hypothetical protein